MLPVALLHALYDAGIRQLQAACTVPQKKCNAYISQAGRIWWVAQCFVHETQYLPGLSTNFVVELLEKIGEERGHHPLLFIKVVAARQRLQVLKALRLCKLAKDDGQLLGTVLISTE